jgi:hypothetical protein
MMFSGKPVYNKLVANLLIYVVFKFHDIWLSSFKVMNVASSCYKVLALWIFQDSQPTLYALVYFGWESFWDV